MRIISYILITIAILLIIDTIIKSKDKTTIVKGSELYETDVLQQLEMEKQGIIGVIGGRKINMEKAMENFTGGQTSTGATYGISGIRTSDPYADRHN